MIRWRPARTRTLAAIAVASSLALVPIGAHDAGAGSDPVTVTFCYGFTGPDRPALEALVKQFNAAHPDIKVQLSIMPWDVFFQKLLPSLASDKVPPGGDGHRSAAAYFDHGVFRSWATLSRTGPTSSPGPGGRRRRDVGRHALRHSDELHDPAAVLEQGPVQGRRARPEPADDVGRLHRRGQGDNRLQPRPVRPGDRRPRDHPDVADPIWAAAATWSRPTARPHCSTIPRPSKLWIWGGLVRDNKISRVGLGGADADKLFQSGRAAMEVVGPWMTTGFNDAGLDFGLAMPPVGPAMRSRWARACFRRLREESDDATAATAAQFINFWDSAQSQVLGVGIGLPADPHRHQCRGAADNPSRGVRQASNIARFYLTNVKDFTAVDMDIFTPALQRLLNGEGTAADLFGAASDDVQAVLDEQ